MLVLACDICSAFLDGSQAWTEPCLVRLRKKPLLQRSRHPTAPHSNVVSRLLVSLFDNCPA